VEKRDPDFEIKMANVLHVYKEVEIVNEYRRGELVLPTKHQDGRDHHCIANKRTWISCSAKFTWTASIRQRFPRFTLNHSPGLSDRALQRVRMSSSKAFSAGKPSRLEEACGRFL
jgi:hypothetical protein